MILPLEPGRHALQVYLLDGVDEKAYGSHTLYFESEPARTQGGMPFEPIQVHSATAPMWELKMEKSQLHFPAGYPLHTASPQDSALVSFAGHDPFELEININGLLQWALEPLFDEEADSTRLESLRDAKPDLVDDDAWDRYMDCLARLEADMENHRQEKFTSPIDFALKWRKTVAAIHKVLIPRETN